MVFLSFRFSLEQPARLVNDDALLASRPDLALRSTPMLPLTLPRESPLIEGRLVRRYKRFLADVELEDGSTVIAHCVNTGAMEGLCRSGGRVWLSRADNPQRKLAYTWELVEVDGTVYGANTALPNRLVRRLLETGGLPWLGKFDEMKPEKRYGERSRVDFWLRRGRRETFVEVKNCHLLYPDRRAYFPDSVSRRATGHLHELAEQAAAGHRAHVLFTCQMPGVKAVRPSDIHDPAFAAAAREVRRRGVRFSAVEIVHGPEEIVVTRRVPVDMSPYGIRRVERFRTRSGEGVESR
jgi:sugar fermentation stimulation protein A